MSSTSKVSGRLVDRRTKGGVADALVIILKPGVSTAEFVQKQQRDMALTSTRSDSDGQFVFPDPLPAGQSYSLIVVARGYADEVLEDGVRIAEDAAPEVRLMPIRLDRAG
jgi:hypothetical protein